MGACVCVWEFYGTANGYDLIGTYFDRPSIVLYLAPNWNWVIDWHYDILFY